MRKGFYGCRPNERVAAALMLEANLGLRVSDIVKLRLADSVKDGERYRLLQHSSAAVTQWYIGIQPQEIEQAIERHLQLDV